MSKQMLTQFERGGLQLLLLRLHRDRMLLVCSLLRRDTSLNPRGNRVSALVDPETQTLAIWTDLELLNFPILVVLEFVHVAFKLLALVLRGLLFSLSLL